MKKTFLTIVCCLCGILCTAQISYHQGDKVNKKAYAPNMIHLVPAADGNRLLSVEPDLNAFSDVKGIKVRLIDSEWNESCSANIDDTKDNNIIAAFRTGSILHVILNNDEEKHPTIRHIAYDANTLKVKEDNKLVNFECSNGEKCYSWTALSPNGEYFGIVYILWNKKEHTTHTLAILYDKEMNKLWEQILYYGAIDQILVTDQGTIATACLMDNDNGNNESLFLFNTADAKGEHHAEFALKDDVTQISLLNQIGNRILVSTLEGKLGRSIWTDRHYTGIHVYLFDLESQKLVNDSAHPLTNDDIRVFDNTLIDIIPQTESSKYIITRDQIATPNGGAVLYQKTWHEETRNIKTGMSSNEKVYSMGMLLVQADMEGNIKWVRGIRQENQNANWPPVGADLFLHSDKLFVITNESKGDSDTYDPSRPAHRGIKILKANAALSIYYFTPDGVGAKQMLQRDGTHILFTPVQGGDNGKYYFLTGAIQPKISTITIP